MCRTKLFTLLTLLSFTATAFPQVMQMPVPTTIMEKKPGIMRIGITSPIAEMGQDFTFADTPLAMRNTLEVALKEDHTELVFLESTMPDKEAKQKKCDYIFYSKVTRKKGGGGFGGLGALGGLAGMAGMIPGVGIAGAVAGAVASTAITTAAMSGGFKSKDEVSFEYSLAAIDGTVLIPLTKTKAKAKKDGEDVLTPQIRTATEAAIAKIAIPLKP